MNKINVQIPEGMSANVRKTANGLNISFEKDTIISWETDTTTITWGVPRRQFLFHVIRIF